MTIISRRSVEKCLSSNSHKSTISKSSIAMNNTESSANNGIAKAIRFSINVNHDEYLSSSWLTLMENRIALAMPLLAEDSVLFIAIDDFEMVDLCELLDRHFSTLRREMIVINHHPQGGKAK